MSVMQSVGAYRAAPVYESAALTLDNREGGHGGSEVGVAFGAAEPLKPLTGARDDLK